jgi:hypothetical protein
VNQNIRHVGLDVDDTQYHGSAFAKETGEVIDFRCRPAGAVLRRNGLHFKAQAGSSSNSYNTSVSCSSSHDVIA